MRLRVNGEIGDYTLPAPTIAGLLKHLGHPPERVAVERNGVLVPRAEHAQTELVDDDTLEVVTLVGGG